MHVPYIVTWLPKEALLVGGIIPSANSSFMVATVLFQIYMAAWGSYPIQVNEPLSSKKVFFFFFFFKSSVSLSW